MRNESQSYPCSLDIENKENGRRKKYGIVRIFCNECLREVKHTVLTYVKRSGVYVENSNTPDFIIRVRPNKHEPDFFYTNKYMRRIEKELF